MKKIILSAIAIVAISISTFAQSPEAFKYQAVVRDASQNVLPNQAVGMQLTILQGSTSGTIVYQETFAPTSNAYGLVNLEIGTGTVVSGTFATIDWSAGPYFIETAMDATGGTTYIVMGASQLLSVPYALHAKTAGSVVNDLVNDADSVLGNEYNTTVVLNGTNLETTDGGGTITTDLSSLAVDNVNDADSVIGNEYNTTVALNGTNLETTDGGGTIITDLSSLMVGADTLWAATGNDISNLNTGNVGIGVPSPNAILDVKGSNIIGSTSLAIRNGMDVSGAAQLVQIKFGFANSDNYPHFIVSRHNAGSPIGNALEFYVSDGTANGTFPANAVHTMSLNGGNVGIGTTTPSAKLHVIGGANTSANQSTWTAATIIDNATGSTQLPIELNVAGTTRATLRADVFGNLALAATGTGGISLGGGSGSVTLSNNSFYDGATGNLGLGTTTPSEKISITNGSLYTNGEGNGIIVGAAGFKGEGLMKYFGRTTMLVGNAANSVAVRLGRWSGGTITSPTALFDDLVITGTGNVGIGTATPIAKLELVNNPATGALDNFSEYQILLHNSSTAAASYGFGIRGNTLVYNSAVLHDFDVNGVTSVSIDANGIVQDPWTNITLINGWVNFGGAFATAQYYKDKEGVIHVKGLIAGGSSAVNTVLFNLPVGYRPTETRLMDVMNDNINSGVQKRVDVQANGNVVIQATNMINSWISLEFSFRP